MDPFRQRTTIPERVSSQSLPHFSMRINFRELVFKTGLFSQTLVTLVTMIYHKHKRTQPAPLAETFDGLLQNVIFYKKERLGVDANDVHSSLYSFLETLKFR